METRVCSRCKQELPLTEEYFHWANKAQRKYQYLCKPCRKEYLMQRYKEIKEEGGERLERIKASKQRYVDKDPEREAERQRIKERNRYQSNPEHFRQRRKEWYRKNREREIEKAKRYRAEHRERTKEVNKKYKETHKEEIKIATKKYRDEKYKDDPHFKFKKSIYNMINQSFAKHGSYKPKKNKDILGITSSELYFYLLQTFVDTYGYEWDFKEPVHIDHIIPLATAKTQEDIVRLCHYKNLRLLKASDNIKKRDRLDFVVGQG